MLVPRVLRTILLRSPGARAGLGWEDLLLLWPQREAGRPFCIRGHRGSVLGEMLGGKGGRTRSIGSKMYGRSSESSRSSRWAVVVKIDISRIMRAEKGCRRSKGGIARSRHVCLMQFCMQARVAAMLRQLSLGGGASSRGVPGRTGGGGFVGTVSEVAPIKGGTLGPPGPP